MRNMPSATAQHVQFAQRRYHASHFSRTTQVALMPPQDIHQAKLDRQAFNNTRKPSTGAQMAFAMVDAAIANSGHDLAPSIGRAVSGMANRRL